MRLLHLRLLFIAAGAAGAAHPARSDVCADARNLRLIHGKIVTMDARNTVVSEVTIQDGRFAAVGKTAQASRGLAILAVLILVMLGGAWVPSIAFPPLVRRLIVADPVRWSVDGFDGVLWQAPFAPSPAAAVAALVVFAGLFLTLALKFFRWERV